jgi:hypothetical protein
MANTTSLAWPNMFDVARNRVSVNSDDVSVTNRTKLLFMTDPTELYNNLNQGAGLRQYLWNYNSDNTVAMIQSNMVEQLRLHEPSVYPDKTAFTNTLLSGDTQPDSSNSKITMTVAMQTVFGSTVTVNLGQQS